MFVELVLRVGVQELADFLLVFLARARDVGERERRAVEAELEQAAVAMRLVVILPLLRRRRDDPALFLVEVEHPVNIIVARVCRRGIRQEDVGLAAFDDGGRDLAACDVFEVLCREDDRHVVLAHDFEPFADFRREQGIVEEDPALIKHDDRRASRAVLFEPVKNVLQRRHDGAALLHEFFHLKDLPIPIRQGIVLAVEQPAIRATFRI